MQNLKTFVRAIKRDDYVTDDEIIEVYNRPHYGLKDPKDTGAPNGYNEYFENCPKQ